MKKGQILLIRYRFDPCGWLIRKFTKGNYNHCAWALDSFYLLEAKGRKICITHSDKYIDNINYKVKLLKIENIKKETLKKAIKCGLSFEGRYNYFGWLWTIFLIAINSKRHLKRLTCSGLIAKSLSFVGVYFRKDKNPDRITPADIENSNKIKNISGQI